MHPIMNSEIIKVRTAELDRRVRHASMVQAARAGRRPRPFRMPQILGGLRPWPLVHRPAI